MKILVISILCGCGLLVGACQSSSHRHDFGEKTHRTYNPQTGSFEQAPPWGKQGNKDDSAQ